MTRYICFLLATCLLLTVFSRPSATEVQRSVDVDTIINQLDFTLLPNTRSLLIATDDENHTWIRGIVPPQLINVPAVLRIPSTRIHDYGLFVRQQHQITAVDDGSPGLPKTRYRQYNFTPQDSVFYLRVKDHAPQLLEVEFSEYHQFVNNESFNMLLIGLYYGLALMSLIFNLVFYLVFRDKRFSTYCLLLLSVFVSFFYEDGMFHYFSGGKWNLDRLIVLNSAFSAIVSFPFTLYFLDIQKEFLRFRKRFFAAVALLLTCVAVYSFTDSSLMLFGVYAFCFLFAASCLFLAAKRFRKDIYARFLVLSFSLVVLAGLLYVCYTRIDSSVFGVFGIHTFRFVSALEIIGIGFAIIFRVRALQHENERYRSELDNYLKALEVKAASERFEKRHLGENQSTKPTKQEVTEHLREQYDLTDREIDVLLCIWDGLTNKEIAERLFITVSTAKYHISNLYVKLDVKNRNQVQVLGKAWWASEASSHE